MAKQKNNKQSRSKQRAFKIDGQEIKLAYYIGKYENSGNYMVAVNLSNNNPIVDAHNKPIPFSKINYDIE